MYLDTFMKKDYSTLNETGFHNFLNSFSLNCHLQKEIRQSCWDGTMNYIIMLYGKWIYNTDPTLIWKKTESI